MKKRKGVIDISGIVKDIKKSFGEESIVQLGKGAEIKKIPVTSTGIISLNNILGIGGYPVGKVIEIYGPESSGKTTLALEAANKVQKANGVVAFIDVEHALNPPYAKTIGIDLDKLIFSQPNSGEQAMNIVEKLIDTNKCDMIIIDSVAALTPQKELDGDMESKQMGEQARLMGKALRKINSKASKAGVTLLFINQVRDKIGIMWGDKESTPGGKALKFYTSIRLRIVRTGSQKKGTKIISNIVKVIVKKNKCAAPFGQAIFEIKFNKGVNKILDLITILVSKNIIKQQGRSFIYKKYKFKNEEELSKIFKENKKLKKKFIRLAKEY